MKEAKGRAEPRGTRLHAPPAMTGQVQDTPEVEAVQALWVDRGPRIKTVFEKSDSELAHLDPGSSVALRVEPREESVKEILRTYRREQAAAEQTMLEAWGGEEERW